MRWRRFKSGTKPARISFYFRHTQALDIFFALELVFAGATSVSSSYDIVNLQWIAFKNTKHWFAFNFRYLARVPDHIQRINDFFNKLMHPHFRILKLAHGVGRALYRERVELVSCRDSRLLGTLLNSLLFCCLAADASIPPGKKINFSSFQILTLFMPSMSPYTRVRMIRIFHVARSLAFLSLHKFEKISRFEMTML